MKWTENITLAVGSFVRRARILSSFRESLRRASLVHSPIPLGTFMRIIRQLRHALASLTVI